MANFNYRHMSKSTEILTSGLKTKTKNYFKVNILEHSFLITLIPEYVKTKCRKVQQNFRRSEHFEYHKIKLLEKCI